MANALLVTWTMLVPILRMLYLNCFVFLPSHYTSYDITTGNMWNMCALTVLN
jgi:hypothetical protein